MLKIETLEEPLHVSSPIGTRVSVDKICRDCELYISRILLIVDLRVMDMSGFNVILEMDWLCNILILVLYNPKKKKKKKNPKSS